MARLEAPTNRGGRRGRQAAGSRPPRKRFLIVCEGEVTETLYFESFPVATDVRVTVKGEGKNTTSLVATAKSHADKGSYNEVWVVYDHDDFGAELFNAAEAAIRNAGKKRREAWHAAWSNQAFEVWYLLHFDYFDGKLHRHLVQEKVNDCLANHGGYRKNRPDMYELLKNRQGDAIRRAEKLTKDHGIAPHGSTPPASANPCTTVHRLVQALNAQIPT